MEMTIKKEELNCLRKIVHICTKSEVMQDCVVPDTYPDISTVIDICAEVYIEEKTVSESKASVSGSICTTVLYISEDCELFRLKSKIPYTMTCDSDELELESELVTKISLLAVDVKVLNPRKILICGELMCKFLAFKAQRLEITTGIEGMDSIHTKIETCHPMPLKEVSEKDFIITEEISLPPAPEGYDEILCQGITFDVEEIKYVGTKMIFKGEAYISILASPSGNKTPVRFSSSCNFSQIIQLEQVSDNTKIKLLLGLVSCETKLGQDENSKQIVQIEMDILAQAVSCEAMELNYIADAYSNYEDCILTTQQISLPAPPELTEIRDNLRVLLETSNTATEVIDISARAGEAYIEDGQVRAKICIRTMYKSTEGNICGAQKIEQLAIDCDKMADNCNINISLGEIYASITTGGIDVRLPVEIEVVALDEIEITVVTDIKLQEPEEKIQRPAMTIVPAGDTPNTWELAKKYHSTVKLIEQENPEEADIIIIQAE